MSTISTPAAEIEGSTYSAGRGHKAVFQGMVGKVSTLVVNAATGIIAARFLAPVGRGEQAAISLWPMLLGNATTLGLPLALSYHLRKSTRPASQLVASGSLLSLLIALIVGSVAAMLMPTFLSQYPASTIGFARLFLLTIPIGSFMLVARAVLEASGLFSTSVLSQLFSPVLTLLLLLAFVAAGQLNPVTASIAYTANSIPIAIWLYRRLRRVTHLDFSHFFESSKTLLSFGLPAYGIDLCGTLSQYVDQALVVHFLEPQAMGVYVVALSVSRMLNFCQASVTMVLLPKAAALDAEDAVNLTVKAARMSLFVSAVIAAGVVIISPLAVRVLYGPSFEEAIAPLRLLLVEAVIGGTVMVLAQAALALGRPAVITALQLIGLLITVPLMLVLLPMYGLIGAALSLLISTVVRLILMMGCFRIVLGHPTPSLIPGKAELGELFHLGSRLLGLNRFRPA